MAAKTNVYTHLPDFKNLDKTPDLIKSFFERYRMAVEPEIMAYFEKLGGDWCLFEDIKNEFDSDKKNLSFKFYSCLKVLSGELKIVFASSQNEPVLKLTPFSEYFDFTFPELHPEDTYKVSRFAYIRNSESGKILLGSPMAYSNIEICKPEILSVYYELCKGATLSALIDNAKKDISNVELYAILQLLLSAKIIDKTIQDSDNLTNEDIDIALRQWEFHDMLLHSHSRKGRNPSPVGGTYRFKEKIASTSATKKISNPKKVIILPAPSSFDFIYKSSRFDEIVNIRKSIRTQGFYPITLQELGCFLYRVGRIISTTYLPGDGEYTVRPYPAGGARYEMELYVTVNSVFGLERGFYYYDALNHQLQLLSEPNEDMELLITDAWYASGQSCWTQSLITVSSRFQRFSWKYEGMSLSAQLKNVGVLYAYMYLTATAMNLAPCALGSGNSERFCKLAGTNYYEENSIGEFMLGSKIK